MLNRIEEIDQLATHIFLPEHFCTRSLQQPDPEEAAESAHLWMELNDFDLAPLAGSNGTMIVQRSTLKHSRPKDTVASLSTATPEEHWIEADTSMREALARLGSRNWLLVREKNKMVGILTIHDLASPLVSSYLLTRILGMEHGLRRLYGSYSNQMIPDEPSETGSGDGWTMEMLMNRVAKQKDLLEDIGFSSGKKFIKELRCFLKLRNHLAHARSILYMADSPFVAADILSRLESLTSTIFGLVRGRASVWERFESTVIVSASDPKHIWSGAGASFLPMTQPVFVISAQNPHEQILKRKDNLRRHRLLEYYLRHQLSERSFILSEVLGSSPCGSWSEESWAVGGITRDQAIVVGRHFAQRAVFELTEHDVRVIPIEGPSRDPLQRCR